MWTVFIGVALGVLELVLLRKTVEMMSASKTNIPLGVLITIGKLAIILVVLYVIAKYISLTAMLWCAGGLAGTVIILSVAKSLSTIRRYQKQTETAAAGTTVQTVDDASAESLSTDDKI